MAAQWCFFYQEGLGPEEKYKGPTSGTESPYFPTAAPPSDFQHHHAHHYRCQKLWRGVYELSGTWGWGELWQALPKGGAGEEG